MLRVIAADNNSQESLFIFEGQQKIDCTLFISEGQQKIDCMQHTD